MDYYPRRLCLLNQYSKPCRQPAPDSVKFAIAFLLITQLFSPFIRRILAGEKGGGPKVIPQFNEMVQDLDPFLGVSADSEIINEQQLDTCIVPDPLAVLAQIFLPVEDDQFIQQIAIVYKLTAVIAPTCLYTTGRQEIGLARAGNSIDPYILPVFSKVKFQDLFNSGIIIDAPVAGFRFSTTAPLLIRLLSRRLVSNRLLRGFYVLRLQDLTNELQSGIAAEFRTFRQFCEMPGGYRQAQCVQHLIDIGSLILHSRPPFPDVSAGS